MSQERILQAVTEGIVELMGYEREVIKPESLLDDDLEMDFLDYVALVMYVEDWLDIEIPDHESMDLSTTQITVQKVVDFVSEQGKLA